MAQTPRRSMLVMMLLLIAQTGLLSFVSRDHVGSHHSGATLNEVRLQETTTCRAAARSIVELLSESAR